MALFWKTVTDGCRASLAKPEAVIQLVSCALIVILFIFILSNWTPESEKRELEILLLLVGIFSILAMVLRTQNAFAISVSILIIGTVVAGERSIAFMTGILKGSSAQEMQTIADIYRQQGKEDFGGIDNEELVSLISQVTSKGTSTEGTDRLVTEAMEAFQVQPTVRQILEQGALTPLTSLAKGGREWSDFVAQFGTLEAFQEDMRFLRRLRIIEFDDDDFLNAEITSEGRAVLRNIELEQEGIFQLLPDAPDIDSIDDKSLIALELGKDVLAEFVSYRRLRFKVEVPEGGTLVVETREESELSPLIDTLVRLLDSNLMELAQDDDGAEDLYSRLTHDVSSGSYVIDVQNLLERPGKFIIKASLEEESSQ